MPKLGVDDYLLTHTREDLLALPVIELDNDQFAKFTDQYRKWKTDVQQPIEQIGYRNTTDLGNGERLALRQRDSDGAYLIHYSEDAGWRYFAGTHWQVDRTQEIGQRAAQVVRMIHKEAEQCHDEDTREKLKVWAYKSESAGKIGAMIEMAKVIPGIAVEPDVWDTNPFLLNVKNGTLDLEKMELRPHRRDDLQTRCINIDYDAKAKCPQWEKFLERVIPDADDRRFVQKAVGYSLTGSIREECFFLLYGTGQNGKSKFLDTIKALLGDYSSEVPIETLMATKVDSTGAKPEIAGLRGMRFVTASENEANRRLATSLIKQMTGGGKMRARFLYHNDFSFTPTHKLWLEVNHKPQIPDTDEGIWRRVRMIPFLVTIPEEERDRQLFAKLCAELPGILVWALEGLRLWLDEELGWSDNVREFTKTFREESDPLKEFMEQCCITKHDVEFPNMYRVGKADLLQAYENFCKDSGERPMGARAFAQHMRERGFEEVKSGNARYWLRIVLRSQVEDQ